MTKYIQELIWKAFKIQLERSGISYNLTGSRAVGKHTDESDYDVWIQESEQTLPIIATAMLRFGAEEKPGYEREDDPKHCKVYELAGGLIHVILVPLAYVPARISTELFMQQHADLLYLLPKELRREAWRAAWNRAVEKYSRNAVPFGG